MLNLTQKEVNKLLGKRAQKPRTAPEIPRAETVRGEIGEPTGEVTHRLVKSLHGRYDNAPPKGSLARCDQRGKWWFVDCYAPCGEVRFMMTDAAFREHFREEGQR